MRRVDCSVYDLDAERVGRFDLVFCGALLEHLRDPVTALERMRDVCDGELLLVEHLDPWLELATPRVPTAAVRRRLGPVVARRTPRGSSRWWSGPAST